MSRPGGVLAGPRRHRVKCTRYDGRRPSGCKFNGYRNADTPQEAGTDPCPRCGAPVKVKR